MTAVKLDDTGDIELDNGNLVLTTNDSDDEIIQRLRGRLQLFLGEWFLNTSIGIPYLQLVYRKGSTQRLSLTTSKMRFWPLTEFRGSQDLTQLNMTLERDE